MTLSSGAYADLVAADRVQSPMYTDPAVFDAEMEKIFSRTWVWVAHASEVAEPGSFVLSHVGTQPVIVSRDREGALHVLVNRCRHRAATVCEVHKGRYSRLGVTIDQFNPDELDGIDGLHFHALCEQNSDALEHTLQAVEEKFGSFIPSVQWINFGGGHHISRPDYDVQRLCTLIDRFQQKYGVAVYLEPGEAIALNTGVLVSRVLDIIHNEVDIAMLDTSAAAHMPDVLEMPYRPRIRGAGQPGEFDHTYKLGGLTCLAGDVIGDYSFEQPLTIGEKLIFEDMAHYTMVKNNTFNGVRLPSIAIFDSKTGRFEVVRTFGYEDYRNRLS